MDWFNGYNKSSKVFLTLGLIWVVVGLGYDDYELKVMGVVFLLIGMISAFTHRSV